MKRIYPVLFALLLIASLALLSGCAPQSAYTEPDNSSGAGSIFNNVRTLSPTFILAASEGVKTYAIYEFDNSNGQHCTVVADIHVSLNVDSNSAPAIDCQ